MLQNYSQGADKLSQAVTPIPQCMSQRSEGENLLLKISEGIKLGWKISCEAETKSGHTVVNE